MNVDSILQEIGAMKTKMNKKEKIVKTPEEAIETIKSNMPTSGYQMLRESLIMAIGALEKQLPKGRINPMTNDFYEYQVTAKFGEYIDVRHYKFGRGHWWHGPAIVDKYVIAWRPIPDPYEPKEEI